MSVEDRPGAVSALVDRVLLKPRERLTRLNLGDALKDSLSKCGECVCEREDGQVASPRDAYLVGEAGIHIHLTAFHFGARNKTSDLCAVIERLRKQRGVIP